MNHLASSVGPTQFPADASKPAVAKRLAVFSTLALLCVAVFWRPLFALVRLALASDPHSHTIIVPLISATLIWWQRKKIFSPTAFNWVQGALLFIPGVILYWFGHRLDVSGSSSALSFLILSLVILLIGSFASCFGLRAARTAAFPLLFLLLMVPIPTAAVDAMMTLLQHWSADLVALIFRAVAIPVHREGLVFDLPGVSIFVAKECSGIHSCIALFLTALLAAQFVLQSNWRKGVLCALVVPIAVTKNALRIVTLTSLAIYVDPSFLSGRLHHYGGIPFFLVDLVLLYGLLRLLKGDENRRASRNIRAQNSQKIPVAAKY